MQDATYSLFKTHLKILLGLLLVASSATFAMVFDNRYFALLQQPYIYVENRLNHIDGNFFVTTASKAIGATENDIGIPELYGEFDLVKVAQQLTLLGQPNPVPTALRMRNDVSFRMQGKIQSQGVEFSGYKSLACTRDILGFGFNWMFMRSDSSQDFIPKTISGMSDEELSDIRRQVFRELGITQVHATQFGMGDLDLYFKLFFVWHYLFKFKRLDTSLRVGGLLPAGEKTEPNVSASLPFGANGAWGIYLQNDTQFELRDDLTIGLTLRLSKRFAHTRCERMPLAIPIQNCPPLLSAPQPFGAVAGPVTVDQGLTFVFAPYGMIENLRQGLGIRLNYFLTKHWKDTWTDKRADQTLAVELNQIERLSKWKTDYVGINVFYDFGKVKVERGLDPIVIFTWDIPSLLFSSELAATTHRVSLGVDLNF